MQTLLKLIDSTPSGWFSQIASQLGTSMWQLFAFLIGHPTILIGIEADILAQNWSKLEADIVAAWQASQPVAPVTVTVR